MIFEKGNAMGSEGQSLYRVEMSGVRNKHLGDQLIQGHPKMRVMVCWRKEAGRTGMPWTNPALIDITGDTLTVTVDATTASLRRF